MTLYIQNLRTWIRRKLGEPIVCVEMKNEQIEQCIEDAFLWWSSYRGWYMQDTITITQGTVEYDLSAHDPEVLDIIKVWFTLNVLYDLNNAYPGFLDIDGYPYDDLIDGHAAGGFYSGLVQWLQMRDTASRVLSADRDYIFDFTTKKVIFTPDTIESGQAIYLYQTPFKQSYLNLVPPDQQYLIRERALAETKYTLGRIRGKYTGGLPAAQGNVSLDGGDLISEAKSDFERLDQKIIDLMPPPGIVIG